MYFLFLRGDGNLGKYFNLSNLLIPSLISYGLLFAKSYNNGIRSIKAVSLGSFNHVLIPIPFLYCNLKFSGVLSIISVVSKLLPIFVRSFNLNYIYIYKKESVIIKFIIPLYRSFNLA